MKNAKYGVVIVGAYGMDNAGDEATLRSIVSALREFDRQMPLWVIGRNPKKTAAKYGVKAIGRGQLFAGLRALGQAQLFLLGGGTLLQDVTSRRSLWYYLTMTELAHRQGCTAVLYGGGVGPVRHRRARQRTATVLNRCAALACLRDEKSAAALAAWGVTGPKIVQSADPVFRLSPPERVREKTLGFALRPWPGVEKAADAFARAARYGYEHYGLTPAFFALGPGDGAVNRQVIARLGELPYRVCSDPGELGCMSAVLSMRLHGLIFALLGGAGCAGVSYDEKVSSFCRENGLPCTLLGDVSPEALCGMIDRAVQSDGEALAERRERLRRAERRNSESLWELLSPPEKSAGND